MDKIHVIIPCAGSGQRFIGAGYDVYKPVIDVFKKPMICYVIDAFPENANFWIIVDNTHQYQMTEFFEKDDRINVINITPHKKGPAWSLLEAADRLPQNEACFIAYNDVMWKWNFTDVQNFITANLADGVIFTQTGFHPHLYKNNFSAFCRTDGNRLLAIKEKGSFTENWMNEALSIGVYYFANSTEMLCNARNLIDFDLETAGEYYPSEIFNLMLGQNLSVFTYETSGFLHVGIPEQLEDAEEWEQIIHKSNKPHGLSTLIMMCGKGIRMKSVARENKAGILIGGRAMHRLVAKKNGSFDNIYLVNDETKKLLDPSLKALNIHFQTRTQIESLRECKKLLINTNRLLVLSNDCYGIFDPDILAQLNHYKMVLFGFRPRLLQRKQGFAHSGFLYMGTRVVAVHIKSIEEGDLGLAGLCYFPNTDILGELDNYQCENMVYMEQFALYLINKKMDVGFVKLQHYVHLGTPEELYEYLFWKKFFNL